MSGTEEGDSSWNLVIIIMVVALLAFAGYFVVVDQPWRTPSPTTTFTPIKSLSMCENLTKNQTAINENVLSRNVTLANYDEQLWLGFAKNFTSLSYNVTAVAQNDTFGYGPGYLLNGLTPNGLWYQVGVSWNWSHYKGGHGNGFGLFYQVWNATSGNPLFPYVDGSTSPKPFPAIHSNDTVELSLSFAQGHVLMKGHDWRAESEVNVTYPTYGATQFVSYNSHVSRFPSSLLTEWYYVLPFYCVNNHVVYSSNESTLRNAWMSIDEKNFTGYTLSQENLPCTGKCLLFSTPYYSYNYTRMSTLQFLSSNGTILYSNSTLFVTM